MQTDDLAHQIKKRREEEFFGVLALGVLLEEPVECIGAEDPVKQAADHHGYGACFDEALKNLSEHGCCRWVERAQHLTYNSDSTP